jgi:parvulin-like peptidyl-prolyl isomerase
MARIVALFTVVVAIGCERPVPVAPAPFGGSHPDIARERAREFAAEAQRPREVEDPNDVLVTVNGLPVLKKQLHDMIGPLRDHVPPATLVRVTRQATSRIVYDTIIAQYLSARGYRPTPEEIEAEIGRKRRIYEAAAGADAVSLEEALRRQGLSVADMRTNPTPGMLYSCYVRSILSEADIERTFETCRRSFDGSTVRASHILFDTRAVSDPQRRDALRAEAARVRALALAGTDFAALAREHSDCPTKDNGGDLGYFARHGAMDESFAATAFALAVGEVSEVVESSYGFHVIKVVAVKPGADVRLADVRAAVEDAAADARGRQIYDELRTAARVELPASQPPRP